MATITHQQLLRSMDALMDHQNEVDAVVAGLLRPLLDHDLSMVFYDLTTIRSEGLVTVEKDVRKFGLAKEGLIARQFMLGVVQTAEGLPIYHEVFDGNASETKTLLPTVTKVLTRFPGVRRLILVADRGLLSLDNLESLQAIRLNSGQTLEFIIAVPGRRYHEFADLLGDFHREVCTPASEEIIGELAWNDLRLVVAHNPVRAAVQTQRRGRKLLDRGAKARFHHAVCEAHLSKILKIDLAAQWFSYDRRSALAERMDGILNS